MDHYRIVIDDGNTFEGDMESFRSCFFDNADSEAIAEWALEQGSTCQIYYKGNLVYDSNVKQVFIDITQYELVKLPKSRCRCGKARWVLMLRGEAYEAPDFDDKKPPRSVAICPYCGRITVRDVQVQPIVGPHIQEDVGASTREGRLKQRGVKSPPTTPRPKVRSRPKEA